MKIAYINKEKLDSGRSAEIAGGGVKTITCRDRVRKYRIMITNDKNLKPKKKAKRYE